MITIERENTGNTAITPVVSVDCWFPREAYRCHIILMEEEDHSFSAVVLNLPGAGSCGATEEEAIENVREAVLGVIESYQEAGEEIPWCNSSECEIPEGAKQRRILVNG